MYENYRHIRGLEWCPEADLNHRHADFQTVFAVGILYTWLKCPVKHSPTNQSLIEVLSISFEDRRILAECVLWTRISFSSEADTPLLGTLSIGRWA
jgi:hypothetical protein